MFSPIVEPSGETYLRIAQVRARYGDVSHMWVERRLQDDSDFPRPTYIRKRRFWRLRDLLAWERINASRGGKPAHRAMTTAMEHAA